MPNRTIYIADADLPIFEQAQQLAGDNLSATIVTALRRFIEMHEQRQEGFKDISIKVGDEVQTQKRFNGRLLAKGRFHTSKKERVEVVEVYQTRRGKIALYIRNTTDWSQYMGGDWRSSNRFQVFEGMEQLRELIPPDLYAAAEQNLNHGPVEVLDI